MFPTSLDELHVSDAAWTAFNIHNVIIITDGD